MEFTYEAYAGLLRKLRKFGYEPIRFCDVSDAVRRPAIIRHDVDMDLQDAEKMAQLESEMNVKATYFVLLTSDYYNLFARDNMKSAKNILGLGHEIGLHFDITAYDEMTWGKAVAKECLMLGEFLDTRVKSISWHIPKNDLIGVHLGFMDDFGLLNAYDPYFYHGYKYVSDSMMRWREPVGEYIEERKFEKLQILTHPVWYREQQDKTDIEILALNKGKKDKELCKWLNKIKPGFSG